VVSSPFGPLRLIGNPRAVGAGLADLVAQLDAHGLDHEVVAVRRAGDARAAARGALEEGCRYLVAVGGDATVHEVVNGMFTLPATDAAADGTLPSAVAPEAVLGVAPAGAACDFARTFGLDRPPAITVRHLAGDATMRIDVGLVTHVGGDGSAAARVFANVAEVGYGAEVLRRAARFPRWLGRVGALLGAYAAIRRLDRQQTAVTVAHTAPIVPVVNLVVANGQFVGGGMKVAPRALPDDGKFNVQIYTGPRSQVFVLTQKIYRGEHLPDPDIVEYQSDVARLNPEIPLPVEADGQLLGVTPAAFRIVPQALRLKI
jgi:diacylglycerol kinase (ATP)